MTQTEAGMMFLAPGPEGYVPVGGLGYRGRAPMWEVEFTNGKTYVLAGFHLLLTPYGWIPVEMVKIGAQVGFFEPNHHKAKDIGEGREDFRKLLLEPHFYVESIKSKRPLGEGPYVTIISPDAPMILAEGGLVIRTNEDYPGEAS